MDEEPAHRRGGLQQCSRPTLEPARPRGAEMAPGVRQDEAHPLVHLSERRLRLLARLLRADCQEPLQLPRVRA